MVYIHDNEFNIFSSYDHADITPFFGRLMVGQFNVIDDLWNQFNKKIDKLETYTFSKIKT
jgi:hypothetical protein